MCLACSALCHTEALQPDIIVIDALAGGDDKRNKDHAQGTRDPLPPLPDGATGWCACRFCPSLIYSDDDLYCDFDDGPCFVCHRPRKGVDDVCGVIILQKELCDVRLQSSFILCVEQASKQGTCVRQIRGWQMEAYNEARTLCVDFR